MCGSPKTKKRWSWRDLQKPSLQSLPTLPPTNDPLSSLQRKRKHDDNFEDTKFKWEKTIDDEYVLFCPCIILHLISKSSVPYPSSSSHKGKKRQTEELNNDYNIQQQLKKDYNDWQLSHYFPIISSHSFHVLCTL